MRYRLRGRVFYNMDGDGDDPGDGDVWEVPQEYKDQPWAKDITGPDDLWARVAKVHQVPEQFKDQRWAMDLKTPDDVWNKLAGAQKLIGKKGIIPPAQDASPEEWDAFYIAQGRPETPDGYEFTQIEELKSVERNPELDTQVKKIFHKAGIPKQKTEEIVQEVEKVFYNLSRPQVEEMARNLQKTEKIEAEFKQLKTQVLGDQADQTMSAFKEVLKESLGDKAILAGKLDTMDNDALISLMVFAKNIHDKYVGENRIEVSQAMSNMTGDLKTDFQMLSQQKIALRTDANMPEHVRAQKLMQINQQMMKIGAKAHEAGINLFA